MSWRRELASAARRGRVEWRLERLVEEATRAALERADKDCSESRFECVDWEREVGSSVVRASRERVVRRERYLGVTVSRGWGDGCEEESLLER